MHWITPRKQSKYIIEPNGVVIEQFQQAVAVERNTWGVDANDIIVMMVGRMNCAKDQPTLIRAIESLPQCYKCVLVGDGDTMDAVKSSVTDLARVIFLGLQSNIAALLKACDIYVQSSLWEGMPTTILEAMAANRPVLGSAVPGIKELLPTEQLFAQGNSTELANMIKDLTPQQQEQIIARQNKIVQDFSISRITNDILTVYAQ